MNPADLAGAVYWLPVITAAVIGVAVAMYVVMDGFDLGVGILFPFFAQESERDQMMNSVAPFWDGNETWLVLGGNGLFVAFPLAYSIIAPALYVPLFTMLLALVLRGVAFEFRWIAKPHHEKWDVAFAAGSTIAAFAQGVMVGGLLTGIKVEHGQFSGSAFDWLTPFSLMCGFGLVIGYALLGACWLTMKMSGELEAKARKFASPLLAGLVALIALVSVWTPLEHPFVAQRWFAWPNLLYLSPVPLITAVFVFMCWRGMRAGHPTQAFYSAVSLFVVSFLGLIISMYPYLVPTSLTLWQAAASVESQMFLFIGTVILIPFILGYTVFVYYTFRGKVREAEGYH